MAVDPPAVAGDGAVPGGGGGKKMTLRERARARGYTKYSVWGFNSAAEYFTSLKATGQVAGARALFVKHPADALAEREGNELKRTLNGFSVAALGVGMIIGSGIFVSTGVAAKKFAGPAIILSMAIAGLCALLSCLIYAEFSSGWPVAGGSYTFVALTMGELAAFLVVTTLVFEYILANAAVARTFTAYLAQLVSRPNQTVSLTIQWKGMSVDFIALGLVILLTVVLCMSTRGADIFNTVCTGAQMLVIFVLIIAGFVKANPANMTPFAPNGIKGIFSGASFVFFSFIGFDAVATLSEETKKPERDMPVGVVGCISFVTVVYILMGLVLVLMVPSSTINEDAAFAVAFDQAGFIWGRYLVAVGAVLGTTTGAMVGMMGVARLVCSLCRSHIGPPVFGRVNAKRGTPIWATVLTTVFMAPFVLLTDLPALIDMTSAAALAAFAVVAIAHLVKRWNPRKPSAAAAAAEVLAAREASRVVSAGAGASGGKANADAALEKALHAEEEQEAAGGGRAASAAAGSSFSAAQVAGGGRVASVIDAFGIPEVVAEADGSGQGFRARCVIAAIVLLAAGFGVAWGLTENATGLGWIAIPVLAAATYAVAAYGHFTLKKLDTCVFEAPAFPYLPATSLLFNSFLMASLSGRAYWQLAIFWGVMVVVYLLYSAHAAAVFDAIQKRGCVLPAAAAPAAATARVGSVVTHRESATVRGRAGAGVAILPPEYDFVTLNNDDEEEGGKEAAAAAAAPSR